MNELIRENIRDISEVGSLLPLLSTLKVSIFNYKKVVGAKATEAYTDPRTGDYFPAQPETYVPYPEGTQVMIEPSSLESIYPEGIVTGEDGTKYYRSDLVTALLVQAVKEMYNEFSTRISALEG